MAQETENTTKRKAVHVFVNRRKVELEAGAITAAALLEKAGFEGTTWEILQLQGEGDPTGGSVLAADASIELKSGMHFRVLPGNRTFGCTAPLRPGRPAVGHPGRVDA